MTDKEKQYLPSVQQVTDHDKLKAVVKAAIAGGWKPWDESFKKAHKQQLGDYVIETDNDYISIKVCTTRVLGINRYGDEVEEDLHVTLFGGSIPDLLADAGAMKAAFGDGRVEVRMSDFVDAVYDGCGMWECDFSEMEAFLYRSIKALTLIQDGKDAIGYLYDNLPK